MKKQTSLLVGAKVLIDFHNMWAAPNPQMREQLKAETQRAQQRYGQTGVIVDYTPSQDAAYGVLIDGDGTLYRTHDCHFTVTQMPPDDTDPIVQQQERIIKRLDILLNTVALYTIGQNGTDSANKFITDALSKLDLDKHLGKK